MRVMKLTSLWYLRRSLYDLDFYKIKTLILIPECYDDIILVLQVQLYGSTVMTVD